MENGKWKMDNICSQFIHFPFSIFHYPHVFAVKNVL